MSDFRLEKSGHLTGVWKRPKFSRSVRAALGPTRLAFVTLPAALGEAFEGDHSSPMSHPNHQVFSVGKGRRRSVRVSGASSGPRTAGATSTVACFTSKGEQAPREVSGLPLVT